MAGLGAIVRHSLGRFERPVSDAYRGIFINLEHLGAVIEDWASPRSILEIGCGEGALAEILQKRFPEAAYLGIDIIPHLGRMYAGPRDKVRFEHIRAELLAEERSGAFDLIVINDVLHHVPRAERPDVMLAAKKLRAPGGLLVLKDWCRRPTLIHAMVYTADVHIGGDKSVHYMSLDEQKRLIKDTFGSATIRDEKTIRPWAQNHAFLIGFDKEAKETGHKN